MDPVTAIGLVSSGITIVQLGVKATKRGQELSKLGSTEEQRGIKELTEHLCDATETLRNRRNCASNSNVRLQIKDKQVWVLSEKCHEAAEKLLAELNGLWAGSKRQVPGKLIKAFWKGDTLKELRGRLEDYKKTLDTTILINLHHKSTMLKDDLGRLDEQGKCIVRSIMEGNTKTDSIIHILANTNELIEKDGQRTRDHFEHLQREQEERRRYEEAEKEKAREREKSERERLAQIKESLFFPDISRREEEIAPSYPDTCAWMFEKTPQTSEDDASEESLEFDSSMHEMSQKVQEKKKLARWLRNNMEFFGSRGKLDLGSQLC